LERNRIADAEIICELLLPRLSGAVPAAGRASAPRKHIPKRLPEPKTTATAESAEIPELLDAMLAAERTGPRIAQPRTNS
jgi:hypothetical protein